MITLIALYVYTIAAFGFCYIVGHATISQNFREWLGAQALKLNEHDNFRAAYYLAKFLELIQCPACLGFWVGVMAGCVDAFAGGSWLAVPILSLYTCGANFLLGRATGLIVNIKEE